MNDYPMHLLRTLTIILTCLAPLAPAQEPAVAAETNLVQSPKAPISWTVTYTYTEPFRKGMTEEFLRFHARLTRKECTLAGDIRHEVFDWESGLQSEKWALPNACYETLKQDPRKISIRRTSDGNYLDGGRILFPEFSWISGKNHLGKKRDLRTGFICQVYQETEEDAKTKKTVVSREAWIDAETGLPLMLKTAEVLQIYSFSEKTPASLTLPEKFSGDQTAVPRPPLAFP